MICAITGHSGVLGSNFIKLNSKIKFVKFKGDLSKKKEIIEFIKNNKFDTIIHFGAIVPIKEVENNLYYAKKINLTSVEIIAEALKKKKNIWFFFPSSSHVYNFSNRKIKESDKKKPINKYGEFKLKAEKIIKKNLKNSTVKFCIGRIFSFTDIKQKKSYFIPRLFLKKAKLKSTFRDFIHIKDICNCIYTLMIKRKEGTYNIASGKKVNLLTINNLIHNEKINIKVKAKENLYADISKVKKIGWKPIYNIEDILNDYKKIK